MNTENTPKEKTWPWQDELERLYKDFYSFVKLLERYEEREKLIRELDKTILRETDDPSEVYKLVLNEGTKQIGAKYAHILQIKGDLFEIVASNDPDAVNTTYDKNTGIVGRCIRERKIIKVSNCSDDSDYYPIHKDVCAEIAVPITEKDGKKMLGVFNLEWTEKIDFTSEQIGHIELIAGQLALALEQIKLWRCIGLISQFNAQLLKGESVADAYHEVLKGMLENLDFEYGQITQYSKSQNQLRIVADYKRFGYLNSMLTDNESVSGYYLIQQKGIEPLPLEDLSDPKYEEYRVRYWGNVFGENLPGSMLLVPITFEDSKGNEQAIGLINIEDSIVTTKWF
jgi:GAF domain